MGILRDRMIEEMKLRNFFSSDAGVLRLCGKADWPNITTNHRISSARRTSELFLCISRWNGSYRRIVVTGYCSGLRFFYNETLAWDETKLFIPPRNDHGAA